jgi:hypothetical protein
MSCGASCAMPYTNCSNVCVDTTSDPANCGTCAKSCPTGVACTQGSCIVRYGYPTQFGGKATLLPNYLSGPQFDLPVPVTLLKLGVIAGSGAASTQVIMALYADANTKPGSRVAYTASTTLVAGVANEIPVIAPVTLQPGRYWVTAIYNNNHDFPSTTSNTIAFYAMGSFGGTPPDPFPNGGTSSGPILNYYIVGAE